MAMQLLNFDPSRMFERLPTMDRRTDALEMMQPGAMIAWSMEHSLTLAAGRYRDRV